MTSALFSDWADIMPMRMRYFCMGNALVVPVVIRMMKMVGAILEKEY
jgi:DNA (cytosine-5)-methyltransferase 1